MYELSDTLYEIEVKKIVNGEEEVEFFDNIVGYRIQDGCLILNQIIKIQKSTESPIEQNHAFAPGFWSYFCESVQSGGLHE